MDEADTITMQILILLKQAYFKWWHLTKRKPALPLTIRDINIRSFHTFFFFILTIIIILILIQNSYISTSIFIPLLKETMEVEVQEPQVLLKVYFAKLHYYQDLKMVLKLIFLRVLCTDEQVAKD